MIEIVMDQRRVEARKGESLLAVARREGLRIPTLCHHEAVEPAGACRLCVVEITRPQWNGWSRLGAACLYAAESDLRVKTNSDRVRKVRKEVLELLVARCPDAAGLVELAREYGVYEPKYAVRPEGDNCILCDLCTRICQTRVTGAISRVDRGVDKRVATPFDEPSEACIGCLACAQNCPTGAIPFEEAGHRRAIWGKEFVLVPCTVCGAATLTREQAAWISGKTGQPAEELYACEGCKALKTAQIYEKIVR